MCLLKQFRSYEISLEYRDVADVDSEQLLRNCALKSVDYHWNAHLQNLRARLCAACSIKAVFNILRRAFVWSKASVSATD